MNNLRWALVAAAITGLCGCATDPEKARRKFLESGRQYLKKGEHSAAIIQFRNALEYDRRSVETLHNLAEAYAANRQLREAHAALRQAAELEPNRLDVRLSLARLYVAGRDYQNAEAEAEFVIARDAKSAAAYQVLGSALAFRKEMERARQAFEKATELAPGEASPFVSLGLIFGGLGNSPEAERNLRRAIEVDPRHVPGYLGLADFYRRGLMLPKAEEVLAAGLDRNPEAVNLYLASAELFLAQAKTDALDALLEKSHERLRKPEAALALGDFFGNRNLPERAIAEYRRALQFAPKQLEIKSRLVEQYLAAARIDEAERYNREILRDRPKDIAARVAQGRILLAQGKREEAIAVLRPLASEARDSAPAHYALGLAYVRNLNPSQAKAEFQEALRLAPEFLPARLSLTELQMNLGELAAARDIAEETVRMYPAAPAARIALGNVLLRQRDFAAARQHLSAARQLAPDDPAALVGLGMSYAGEGKWAEAEREFESALKLNPRHGPALSEIAGMWVRNSQSSKAIARLQQHTATHPDDANGRLLLGSLFRQVRQYGPAETELLRAVHLDPSLIQAHLQLGGLFQDQGQIDAAIRTFETALKIEPRSSALHALLGNAHLQKGDSAAARRYFEQGLALDPNSALVANNLAWTHVKHGGNLDLALTLAQKARQLAPELVSATNTLGWIQYKKGLYTSAIPLLEECVSKVPESPLYRYHLGMALLAVGEREKSRIHLEAALRLKLGPEDAAEARDALAKIR